MIHQHDINTAVTNALPTTAEQLERASAVAADKSAAARRAAQRKLDAEVDKVRERLRHVTEEINAEPGVRESIKTLANRYAENAMEAAQLEIANRIDKILGLPANQQRKKRIEVLESQNKDIEDVRISAQVKKVRELQARLPELENEQRALKRQLEASMPLYF